MKFSKLFISLAVAVACLVACDDTTDNIGSSILDGSDNLDIDFKSFPVSSSDTVIGSVYSRSTTGYLGCVKDPETGAVIKGNFLTQFYTLEGTQLPAESTIISRLKDGSVVADSCIFILYHNGYYGDSLATMKANVIELQKSVSESQKLYSDFDPEKEGYCRTDAGCVNVGKTYTLYSLAADTLQNRLRIKLPNAKLNADSTAVVESTAYKGVDNKYYYNYGTYLMQKYYSDPSAFKNAINFINKVCPGFYFKSTEGMGSMAYMDLPPQLLVYYKYKTQYTKNGVTKDTIQSVMSTFAGTEEVIQANNITNDRAALEKLVADGKANNYTYIKSPSGIFTELTLPVTEILSGHENDTINSARVALTRVNNSTHENYGFGLPSSLLLLPKDSLKSFFEGEKIADNKTSYVAVFATSDSNTEAKSNAYTFHNIADLITYLGNLRSKEIGKEPTDKSSTQWQQWNTSRQTWEAAHPNWNKVYIVPVTTSYVTMTSSSTAQLAKVVNDMSMSETKLVRGTTASDSPIQIEVVYSKFKE